MSNESLKEIIEKSLLEICFCPGCDTVYMREDMTVYLGEFFAEKYTLLCKKCNNTAELMYPRRPEPENNQ